MIRRPLNAPVGRCMGGKRPAQIAQNIIVAATGVEASSDASSASEALISVQGGSDDTIADLNDRITALEQKP